MDAKLQSQRISVSFFSQKPGNEQVFELVVISLKQVDLALDKLTAGLLR